ncbi:acyltransferase [Rhizobium sp. Td3]|nr:acyltransferase [Rhizobium sp. Td3]
MHQKPSLKRQFQFRLKRHIIMPPKYIANIQILRFFAALLVTFAHMGVAIEDRDAGFRMIYPLDWGLGVDIFFVISGFIMYYLMHNRFQEPGVSRDFLKRRVLRIAPLYWLCTTLMVASIVAAGALVNNNAIDLQHIAASYLFLPWQRTDGQTFPVLSLGWTLNYEMLFYLLFAVVLSMSRKTGLMVLAGAFSALMVAAALAPPSMWLLRFWGNSIIGEFLLGILLAMIFMRPARLTFFTSLALMVAGVTSAVCVYQTESYLYLPRLLTGGIPALLITSAIILGPNAPASAPCKWLARAGDASYALYLTHPFATKLVAIVGIKLGLPTILVFVAGIFCSIVVAATVYVLFEKPFTKQAIGFFSKPTMKETAGA